MILFFRICLKDLLEFYHFQFKNWYLYNPNNLSSYSNFLDQFFVPNKDFLHLIKRKLVEPQSKVTELSKYIFQIFYCTLLMEIFSNKFCHFQLLYQRLIYKPIQRFHLMHLLKRLLSLPKQDQIFFVTTKEP